MEHFNETYCTNHSMEKSKFEHPAFSKPIYTCFKCTEEHEQAERMVEYRKDCNKAKRLVAKHLKEANIPLRFKDCSFEDFIAKTKEQEKALATCKDFAENPNDGTGLLFIGKTGTGKTHLALAILQSRINSLSQTGLFTTGVALVREIKCSWNSSETNETEVIAKFSEPDLLIVDEVGVQFNSDTEKLFLTEIINNRYEAMKQTIIIGNVTLPELTEILGDRIIDRFREGGILTVFDWSSYRKTAKSSQTNENAS